MQDAIKGWKPTIFQDIKKTLYRNALIHEIPCKMDNDYVPCTICEMAEKQFEVTNGK